MESLSILFCPNCNEKYSCIHNFCSNCTELMNNKAEKTCSICYNSFHQNEVKRNSIFGKICSFKSENKKKIEMISCELCEKLADKYCVECSQFICLKCSTRHVKLKICKDHTIVDKKIAEIIVKKSPEPMCKKHKQNFTIYCITCDCLMCNTCSTDSVHNKHLKSDKLEKVFDKTSSDIKNKIIQINDIIKDQNQLIEDNKILESNFIQNCNKVRNEIEIYAEELKDQIDNITKANVDKIILIKNDLIKSVQSNFREINEYILSLTNFKLFIQEIIKKASDVDLFNSKNELIQNTWIEKKKPQLLSISKLYFHRPFLDKYISSHLSGSLRYNEVKDMLFQMRDYNLSACIFKKTLYTVNYFKNCVDIYNLETSEYQGFIDYKCQVKNIDYYSFCLLNTINDLFLYLHPLSCIIESSILKLDCNKTFIKLQTNDQLGSFTSTFQQTLLTRDYLDKEIIELSVCGNELKRITIPEAAIYPDCFNTNTVHQLKDGKYFVTSFNRHFFKISLLDPEGTIIKFFTESTNLFIKICTDGENYIFVLEHTLNDNDVLISTNKPEVITVLSTDLQCLHQFNSPKVKDIYFDQENNKLLLLKNKEIIYFSYHLGMVVPI